MTETSTSDSKQPQSGQVHVYAVETIKTTRDEVSAQGFGYTSPLAVPQKETHFVWKGELFNGLGNLSNSSNARKELDQLASNFGDNYRRSLSTIPHGKRNHLLVMNFGVPANVQQSYAGDEHERVRDLTDAERDSFLAAFQEANQRATRKK